MDRDFERYRGGPNEALAKRLHVTISPQKLILINRNLYIAMGRPEAAHLGYSRERDCIAVEPASPRLPDAFPLVANPRNWRINAAPFCRHFGIEIDTTLKFVRPEIIGRMLLLKLGETVSVARGKRRKKQGI